ncbi:hypothetical protein BDV95DRAFT_580221 [Massariosphaeria phaeospora]|uniref:Uncharacterized protein n=1 Tax=Massariosphaeria phaeospora TaxID=100035 RepID=A0A7C8M7M3_9PLEO|nr:hypothetical protein BDV95DRAFT_580221 [Massariosphaeria phaeospora]
MSFPFHPTPSKTNTRQTQDKTRKDKTQQLKATNFQIRTPPHLSASVVLPPATAPRQISEVQKRDLGIRNPAMRDAALVELGSACLAVNWALCMHRPCSAHEVCVFRWVFRLHRVPGEGGRTDCLVSSLDCGFTGTATIAIATDDVVSCSVR